jgi:hypothetical protein
MGPPSRGWCALAADHTGGPGRPATGPRSRRASRATGGLPASAPRHSLARDTLPRSPCDVNRPADPVVPARSAPCSRDTPASRRAAPRSPTPGRPPGDEFERAVTNSSDPVDSRPSALGSEPAASRHHEPPTASRALVPRERPGGSTEPGSGQDGATRRLPSGKRALRQTLCGGDLRQRGHVAFNLLRLAGSMRYRCRNDREGGWSARGARSRSATRIHVPYSFAGGSAFRPETGRSARRRQPWSGTVGSESC